jgi:hypothetical protein
LSAGVDHERAKSNKTKIKSTRKEQKTMLETITEWFHKPAGQAFVQQVEKDQKAELLKQRQELANAIRIANEQFEIIHPALFKHQNAAESELEAVKQKAAEMIRTAQRRCAQTRDELRNACAKRDAVVTPAEARLRETANPGIDEFARELEKMRSSLRPETETAPSIEGKIIIVRSSHESFDAAISRINAILVRELKALALLPLADDQLSEALEDLRQSIPAIVMKKVR